MNNSTKVAIGILCFVTGTAGQSMTEQQFVTNAAQINMTEAHLGQLAQQKGASDDVKQYGEKIEADHKTAFQQLSAIQGFTVPQSIDSEHQMTISKLDKLSGKAFDTQFKQTMIQDHEKAISLFQKEQTQMRNDQLKRYAEQQLPTLRDHLERAKQLGSSNTSRNGAPAESSQTAQGAEMASATRYGTVTRYVPGKVLELKMRNRVGNHTYDISDGHLAAALPGNLQVGSLVQITESSDPNGRRSIRVELQTAPQGTGSRARKQ